MRNPERRGALSVAPLRRLPRSAAAASLLALLVACSGGPAAGPPSQGPGAVPVTVGRVTREAVPISIGAIGTVESRSIVQVKTQVGGEITAVHFHEGDEVKKGQALFTIDPRSYRAAVAEAEARLAHDRALARNAHQDVGRYADLVKKDYVTQEQYDQIRANAESLEATVAADEAALEQARLELSWTTVRSPAHGRTGKLLVHAGNVVKANDLALVVLQQLEPIDVSFAVPQQYLDEVRARSAAGPLAVRVAPPGGGGHPGTLTFVDNTVDPATGTIQLKATLPNRDRALWPGQFVNVTLDLATEAGALVAPAPAVQTGQEGDYVFVLKDDGTVESRNVEVSRTVGAKAVIAEGLHEGETVVTDGQLRLVPGAKVEVKAGGPTSDAATAPPQETGS